MHEMSIDVKAAGRLMVALDFKSAEEARALIQRLEGIPCYMKVGMQLYYAAGPDFIRELKAAGYSVFLDLKLHDIPNTVRGGADSITRLGVDMFNIHGAGGIKMMQAAREGALHATAQDNSLTMPLIIAVTQLTSTDQHTLNDEIGISGSVEEAVLSYAGLAKQAGLEGVVASPLEVKAIKATYGGSFVTVTPGIRPAGSDVADQSRILTAGQAMEQGTDYIVVGRPITAAADPREALLSIVEEMKSHV
jgi:orotidine-5'-phosphate decarboxylase